MTRLSLIVIFCFGLVAINIYGQTSKRDTSIIQYKEFFIISFGKATGRDYKMTIDEIKKIDSLSITNLNGNKSEYKIAGFKMEWDGNGTEWVEWSSNNKLTDRQKTFIQSLKIGSKLYIENIEVVKNAIILKTNSAISIKLIKKP